jgi:hypothetical protein
MRTRSHLLARFIVALLLMGGLCSARMLVEEGRAGLVIGDRDLNYWQSQSVCVAKRLEVDWETYRLEVGKVSRSL